MNLSSQAENKTILDDIVRAQKRGEARGIYSICSANPFVLEASLVHARQLDIPVLIESTCNQVNQYGGYTGMTPTEFVSYVFWIADTAQFPQENILLGGDHLGPNVWQDEPGDQAMEKSRELVRDYVSAGYIKIHLDASMKCADDPLDRPLDVEVSAHRAAELASAAEEAFKKSGSDRMAPRYVIGTEVPIPGGLQDAEEEMHISQPDAVKNTIDLTRQAFLDRGLDKAWERVIAVVAQPGVEFGDQVIIDYQPDKAVSLSRFIEQSDQLVFEAHSTDYQTRDGLRSLVRDHFAILKVGPALTFAFREAVFALSKIEEELLTGKRASELSHIREVIDTAMEEHPAYWRKYYHGTDEEVVFARKYSLSDRSRYYWTVPLVEAALQRLTNNLRWYSPPLPLISQYLPVQYGRIRDKIIEHDPHAIILDKIALVLSDYVFACDRDSCSV